MNFEWIGRLLAVLLAAVSSGIASAAYPERPLRWVVPAAAGGAADLTVRVVAVELGNRLGQRIVVDNRPGGSGVIGIDIIAKAVPDGYTVGTGNSTNMAINRSVIRKLPYDPDKDLRAVAHLTMQPNLLGVTHSLPVKSVADLAAYARDNPGKLLFGSSGPGSSLHLSAELFMMLTGTRMTHVPFKSTPLANTELMSGQIHLMFDNMSSIGQHVKAGRLRGLGVTSAKRAPAFPDLPTIAEGGVAGYEVTVWGGVVAPSGVPTAIVDRLNSEINKVLAEPAVRERLASYGYQTIGGSAQQFARHIVTETAKWADVIKRAGLTRE